LLATVTTLSAPGSRIACEYNDTADGGPVSRARRLPGMSTLSALWKGGLGTGTRDWLVQRGWQVETHEIGPVAARYGRLIPGQASGGFLTTTRGPGA
jgi:O-methyltransferase involved in polyketide biosynthesis